jgi:hypothetical protein
MMPPVLILGQMQPMVSGRLSVANLVQSHRGHDYGPDNDFLDVIGPTHHGATVSQKGHDKNTYHRS